MSSSIQSSQSVSSQEVELIDLGVKDFKSTWDFQDALFQQIIRTKIENRERPEDQQVLTKHHLIFVEHRAVINLVKHGSMSNLLVTQDILNKQKISFFKINRGGDITYHGPGQLVGYPIFDLDCFFTDIGKYLRYIEEAVIRTLSEYGIQAGRSVGETGVWIDADKPSRARKICAIGIRCSRWVTMHGFAFNINTDLSHFNFIIPCGIQQKAVTSLQQELGRSIPLDEVKHKVMYHFAELFNITYYRQ
ncbi:MAG: lipoyl(octanoyl) transferase LipB [Bacteroidota bacterium]